MRDARLLVGLLVACGAASALDVATTSAEAILGAREVNPFVALLLTRGGIVAFLALRAALMVVLCAACFGMRLLAARLREPTLDRFALSLALGATVVATIGVIPNLVLMAAFIAHHLGHR